MSRNIYDSFFSLDFWMLKFRHTKYAQTIQVNRSVLHNVLLPCTWLVAGYAAETCILFLASNLIWWMVTELTWTDDLACTMQTAAPENKPKTKYFRWHTYIWSWTVLAQHSSQLRVIQLCAQKWWVQMPDVHWHFSCLNYPHNLHNVADLHLSQKYPT